MTSQHPSSDRIAALQQAERERFMATHPASLALADAAQAHYLFGVPLHWMRDWPSPATLFVNEAQGVTLQCADGLRYTDFCLGDTGAMFGHSPEPLAQAIAQQAARGLTCMLPAANTLAVGESLARVFGLPMWQMALTASDANRFVLRWARAITQRPQLLVFDGCYHGAVDDTLVDLDPVTGHMLARPSVLGQVHNHAHFTRVVPFNDLAALEAALVQGDVACLLAEPALTNFGLVPPEPGFWAAARALCRAHGTLFVCDETHTISTALGGYARANDLAPDFLVVGKAVAGGLPCAVYGFTQEVAQRMRQAKQAAPEGHSGIGTTLSGNALALAALQAALTHLHTNASYAHMLALAERLEHGLTERIEHAGMPWTVTRLGARMELQFMPETPRHAQDVRDHARGELEALTHLFMLNRGVLLTPFHSMLLVSPATTAQDVEQLLQVFDALLAALADP
ncbi:MAG: aminotransferase class III-fold pyridoxal phosphate-dependent enzyme [Hydrogenophaga sp.]|jgi:glutamate-1-semialdehyde 2,1-aminomutase|uniref:transaminase n=1 Tax=Hydrogenophaga sp. TaxID=1904254 RepID=UPI001DE23CF4|nr:transaminase [Hydrogenophaga sp.]MBW0172472.1 aminotransferase class III-fold pyridoxal phosphate-dependent enzyme [Hydrogenophaga sp.]MBW0183951.1 aminotransferase class III-fold pyridoxal phosphate-dependent enzyme [Hydrogenophaga sp.]